MSQALAYFSYVLVLSNIKIYPSTVYFNVSIAEATTQMLKTFKLLKARLTSISLVKRNVQVTARYGSSAIVYTM